jgi:penicillin-binding protein 1A
MAEKKKGVFKKVIIGFLLSGILLVILILGGFLGMIFMGAFGPLPSTEELANLRDDNATLVYSSDKELIGKIFSKNHTRVNREALPQHLIDALISTEDVRFYEHNGIDNRSLMRVILKSILMGNRSSGGGSTITQQLAKNLYGREDFGLLTLPVNKIREAIIAVRLEEVYSKDDILLLYLNMVPFGEEVFGIEAAANRYYNKTASELDIDEAALLIGLLKGNTYYHPRLHPERALERRNLVLQLMNEQGKIENEIYQEQILLPLDLDYSNLSYEGPAQYFLYQVEKRAREILNDLENKSDAEYDIERDGLIITTTLDSRLQMLAKKAIRKQLSQMQKAFSSDPQVMNKKAGLEDIFNNTIQEKRELWSWDGIEVQEMTKLDSAWHYESMLSSGVLILEPKTGNVKAWVGGNHFRYLPYDLVLAKRMIASSFKPVLYAAAIKDGKSPCDYLDNEEKVYEEYDDWAPKNYDGSSGDETSLWYALVHSLNIPTVDLYFKTGHKNLEEMCYALDIEENPADNPSVALGTMNISLFEATRVYATFANQGQMQQPAMIRKISKSDGEVIYEKSDNSGEKVIEADVANTITVMLQKAINEGTGARIRGQFGIRSDLAGKTGTSQEYSDAWFFSYTPDFACGVWVGARDPGIHFSNGSNGSGSALALPIAGDIIRDIENQTELRKSYLSPIKIPSRYTELMECEGTRTKGAWNRFFESLFKKNKEKEENESGENKDTSNSDTTVSKQDGKVKKFFKKIFKKKEKDD